MKKYTPVEWAREAVEKHTWKHAYRIALQTQGKAPSKFFADVTEWIKKNAPEGALE